MRCPLPRSQAERPPGGGASRGLRPGPAPLFYTSFLTAEPGLEASGCADCAACDRNASPALGEAPTMELVQNALSEVLRSTAAEGIRALADAVGPVGAPRRLGRSPAAGLRPTRVGTAYRYTITVDGEPCMTTDYTLASGQRMVVRTFYRTGLVVASMVSARGTATTWSRATARASPHPPGARRRGDRRVRAARLDAPPACDRAGPARPEAGALAEGRV